MGIQGSSVSAVHGIQKKACDYRRRDVLHYNLIEFFIPCEISLVNKNAFE